MPDSEKQNESRNNKISNHNNNTVFLSGSSCSSILLQAEHGFQDESDPVWPIFFLKFAFFRDLS
jgi:hypothetical protein